MALYNGNRKRSDKQFMSDLDAKKLRPLIGWGIDNENTKCPNSLTSGHSCAI